MRQHKLNPLLRRDCLRAGLVVLCLTAFAAACETPVFRYAMYSPLWAPNSYGVFFFSEALTDATSRDLEERARALGEAEADRPNLNVRRIELNDSDAVAALPPAVRTLAGSKARPRCVIANPRGEVVHAGDLSTAELAALVDSPLRRQLAAQLGAGRIVLLLLEGARPAENQVAEKIVTELIAEVSAGKHDERLAPAAKPGAPALETAPAVGAPSSPKTPRVCLLKVSRGDDKEVWLVRQLMRADVKLDELAERPMLFAVYGQARALPPCIGAGIKPEHILDDLAFLSGPCSCEVKNGNPGTDLLTRTDWPAAVLSMAKVYGDEELTIQLTDVTRLGSTPAGMARASTDKKPPGGNASLADLNPPAETAASKSGTDAGGPTVGSDGWDDSLPDDVAGAHGEANDFHGLESASSPLFPVGLAIGGMALFVLLATAAMLSRR